MLKRRAASAGLSSQIWDSKKESHEGEEIDAIPLLFNGDGEVFYYKDGKNNLRISYRSWDLEDDEQDE